LEFPPWKTAAFTTNRVGKALTLWRVPWYTFPGLPRPTKSHGFRAPPSPVPAADEGAARQAKEDAGTHLVLARGCEKRRDGRRDAEAPESSRIAAAAAAAAVAPLVGDEPLGGVGWAGIVTLGLIA